MFDTHSLFGYSTIASVVSQANDILIVTVKPGDGARFATNQQVTLFPPTALLPLYANAMIGRVTAITGDQLTINYATVNREGSEVKTIAKNYQIFNGVTPKVLKDIEDAIAALDLGAASWGTISGDLADQTDLQSALDAKASTAALNAHTTNTANPHNVTKAQVGLGNVDNTSDANKPISTATQAALDGKAASNHTHDERYYTEAEIATLLAGKANTSHDHVAVDISDFQTAVSANADVAANTAARHSHNNKALLDTYTQTEANLADAVSKKHTHSNHTALDAVSGINTGDQDLSGYALTTHNHDSVYEPKNTNIQAHIASTSNPHSVTKSQVGLGNVDNTSDANKPISTATQTALDGKAALSHAHAIADVTNLQTTLDGKASSSHTHLLAAGATDVTASASELNILDGATLTTTELNYVDGVTSAIQTQLDGKASTSHNHDAAYAAIGHNHDSAYVNVTGDAMTGHLVFENTKGIQLKNSSGVASTAFTMSSGNFIEFGDGNNPLVFYGQSSTMQLDDNGLDIQDTNLFVAGNTRVGEYLRVGSTSAPTNTTAGDLTFVRGFATSLDLTGAISASNLSGTNTGDQDLSGYALVGHNHDSSYYPLTGGNLTGDIRASGYLRVGSTSAPVNTTAGDITAERITIGDNSAFSASGYLSKVLGTLTDTSAGAKIVINNQVNLNPSSNSASEFRLYNLSAQISSGNTVNFTNAAPGGISSIVAEVRHLGSGSITNSQAIQITGLTFGASAAFVSPSVITAVQGLNIAAVNAGASVGNGSITTARGIFIRSSTNSGSMTIGTHVGIDIAAQALANTTTNIGLRIAAPTTATTNYALQLSDTGGTAAGGITFGTDVQLYRSAADTLKTDDSFVFAPNTSPAAALNITYTSTSSTTNAVALAVVPVYTGSANGAQGLAAQPTFRPSANVAVAYGFINIAKGGPPTGVTITSLYGGYNRIDTESTAGAITNAAGLFIARSTMGTLRPTSLRGINVEDIYPTASHAGTTNVVGIQINAQHHGTSITEGLRVGTPFAGTGAGNITDCNAISVPTGTTTLGDQTATTTHQHSIKIGIQTYTSTTNTRTITNAAGLYIEGAPVASTNVTITNGPYAIWSDAGINRFDGDGTHVMELPADATDPTAGGGAAVGRIPVKIGGVTRYLAYY